VSEAQRPCGGMLHAALGGTLRNEGSVMGGWRLLDLHAEGNHLLLQDVVFMRTRGVCWVHSPGTGSGLVCVPAAVKVQCHRHVDVPVGASATPFANTRERYASISPSVQMQASAGMQHWAMQRGQGTAPRASAEPAHTTNEEESALLHASCTVGHVGAYR
jgi:hypothetical protein